MNVQVIAPGSCGELVQGTIDDQAFLVTCPVDLYSRVTVSTESLPGKFPAADPKTLAAVEKTKEYFGRLQDKLQVAVCSDLPVGKGMASSSADISAACLAAALCLGQQLTCDEIADLALAIEPTDGIFYNGIVMFDHVEGRIRRPLGQPPDIQIAVFDAGGEVDTLCFNRRSDLARLNREKEPLVRQALDLVSRGLAQGDASLIGQGATLSARANQSILFKPCLEMMADKAQEYGAIGITAAHSGTVLGLMFNGAAAAALPECVAAVSSYCPEIRYLQTVRLISGGLRVEEANNETAG
ncbi:MAG TPA: GHMP kinase [Patescibacteria group bacterium]|nr:GHMP kinase [Patescibacteria group bacterium]